ncbi:MAG TPA: hypothetical protein PKW70_02450 [Candidatus Pacearchaeota archaeon]|nr:hypothetical protein [Candidatus Pacearchaeota archaeon]
MKKEENNCNNCKYFLEERNVCLIQKGKEVLKESKACSLYLPNKN